MWRRHLVGTCTPEDNNRMAGLCSMWHTSIGSWNLFSCHQLHSVLSPFLKMSLEFLRLAGLEAVVIDTIRKTKLIVHLSFEALKKYDDEYHDIS